MSRQIQLGLLLLFLLIITALLYYPALHGPLLLDDFENLKPLADFSKNITTWRDVLTTSSSSALGRPIAMLSFIANQWASGGEVWAYKYTNLMIHLLCGVLVFWLCGRLLQQHSLKPYCWMVALWVTAFWLLTPLQVSTVLYVVQRMAQLATLFVLAGLVTYVIGRQNLEDRPKLGIALILSCFLFWLPIATLSKENGILLPLLTIVIEFFFFRFRATPVKKHFLVILYVIFLLFPALAIGIKLIIDPGFILDSYQTRDFTLGERLMTEARILFIYLWTLLIPYGPGLGLYHDDYIKSTGLMTPPTTLLSIFAWILIIALSVLSLKVRTKIFNNASYVIFGLIFFLFAHVLESSILSLELYFEHRNYLPAVGIYISLGIALFSLALTLKKQSLFIFLFVLLPITHGLASYPRIQTWMSWEHILFSSAHAHPQSARVHGDLAIYYHNYGDIKNALFHLQEVEKLNPKFIASSALMRIAIYCRNNQPIPEVEYEQLKGKLNFNDTTSVKNVFRILVSLMQYNTCQHLDFSKFSGILERWLSEPSSNQYLDTVWFIRVHFGKIYYYRGLINQAINQMDLAMALYPDRLEAGLIKLQYQLALNDSYGARKTLSELKDHNDGKRIDFNLAIVYFENLLNEL